MQYTPPQDNQYQVAGIQMSAPSDAARLSDNSINPAVKDVLLSIYLDRVIRQNEKAGVTSDVSVVDNLSNRSIKSHNLDVEQFAASVNKLPIARLILSDIRAGKLATSQTLTWTASDVRAGAGVYDQPGAPLSATVNQLLFDLLNPSGNTAVRVLVNQGLGGAPTVNQRIVSELGLKNTYLQPLTGNLFYVGNTTAREASINIRQLVSGTDAQAVFVRNALATNIYTDYGVRSQLAGNNYITLANKVGILDDVEGNNRHDVGVIYNTKTGRSYAYAFLNTAPGTPQGYPTSQAGVSLADMGRGVLRYSGDKPVGNEKALKNLEKSVERRIRY